MSNYFERNYVLGLVRRFFNPQQFEDVANNPGALNGVAFGNISLFIVYLGNGTERYTIGICKVRPRGSPVENFEFTKDEVFPPHT